MFLPQYSPDGRPVIAIDGDGVLFDYAQAYPLAWERAFGFRPRERDPLAYYPYDRWEVDFLGPVDRARLRAAMDERHWSSMPGCAGAVEGCQILHDAGFALVCVTALEAEHAPARYRNAQMLGMPIDAVVATGNVAGTESPKAAVLRELRPVAFADDYLPYMRGIDSSIHRALIMRGRNGSPNKGPELVNVSSMHANLLDFAKYWVARM